jgi:cytochrome b561
MSDIVSGGKLHYSGTAKLAHWIIAALVALQYYAGLNMGPLEPGMEADGFANLHVTVGPVILILAIWRFVARFTDPVAQLPDIPRWQQTVASLTHTLLYLLLVIQPPLGVLAAQNTGANFRIFGVVPLPHVLPAGSAVGEFGEELHETIAPVLLALIGLHVAAALYHLIIRRDRVMQRMLPGG